MDNIKKEISSSPRKSPASKKRTRETDVSDSQLSSEENMSDREIPENSKEVKPEMDDLDRLLCRDEKMADIPESPEDLKNVKTEMDCSSSDPQTSLTAEDVDPKRRRTSSPLSPNEMQLSPEEEAKLSDKDEDGNMIGFPIKFVGTVDKDADTFMLKRNEEGELILSPKN